MTAASTHLRYINGNAVWWGTHRERLLDAFGDDVFKFLDDFVAHHLTAADSPLGWTVTLVEAGSGESTITKPDGSGGTLLLTTDNAENDGINMQLAGESFQFTANQAATYFGIRFKCSEATQLDWLAGLCITDTDLLGGMTDGVYFKKVDGSTAVGFYVTKDSSTTSSTALATFAANTWVIVEFFWNGSTQVLNAYIDGSLVATPAITNLPDDELLTPSVQLLAGDANARTMTIDWIRAIQVGR